MAEMMIPGSYKRFFLLYQLNSLHIKAEIFITFFLRIIPFFNFLIIMFVVTVHLGSWKRLNLPRISAINPTVRKPIFQITAVKISRKSPIRN